MSTFNTDSVRRYTAVELRFATNSATDYVSAADYDTLAAKFAEQHQGDPMDALLLDDCVEHKHPEYGGGYFGTEVIRLYTHADAGEVERLRGAVNEWENKWQQEAAQVGLLRAQLAERDALLTKIQAEIGVQYLGRSIFDEIAETLSASAEPSAPVERDERASPSDFDIFRADLADHCAAMERKP